MKRLLMTGLLIFGAISSGKAAMAKKIDKEALANKIKALAGLDAEERSELLGLLSERKQYGLVWEVKPEDVEEVMREQLPVLAEVKERAIVASVPSAPNHIFIEGDNLHALTCLTYTHSNKVDVIYIDPPYNTGNKDFVYNDRYIDTENGFRHSLWIQFMAKRLEIAKGLLSDRGVIIVHIDEHEFDALNMLLREIFGDSNSLGQIVWDKLNPKGETTSVAVMHEYILLFAKNKVRLAMETNVLERVKPNAAAMLNKAKSCFAQCGKTIVPSDIKAVLKKYGFPKGSANAFKVTMTLGLINVDFQSWLNASDFSNGEKAYKYIDNNGDIFTTVSMAAPDKPETRSHRPLKHPIIHKDCPVPEKGWRLPDKTMDEILGTEPPIEILPGIVQQGEIIFTLGKDGTPRQPRRKYLLKDNLYENVPSLYFDGSSSDDLFSNLGIKFPYPKPISVGEYLIRNVQPHADTILDFFAGSGTTLHATMNLNAQDGRRRKCILVTNNEGNICDEVAYPRCRKVICGYTNAKGEAVPGLQDNSLRYYKTEFVPRRPSPRNARALMAASVDLLCVKNDLYDEVPRFFGKKLKKTAGRYFDDGRGRRMLVLFDETTVPSVAETIRGASFKGKVKIYVFAHGDYAYNEEFEEVADKVELCALPAAIRNAYRRVIGKYRPQEEDAK